MSRVSAKDNENSRWFNSQNNVNSLKAIEVKGGNIRGIFPCRVDFTYPISCFVGINGSGKSTLLALAACAFHNDWNFSPLDRKKSYYTFVDFFIFRRNEQGLKNIEITNSIHENSGIKNRSYRLKPSGKWQDYDRRAKRNVIFLGVNRIVPPSENATSRSRRDRFSASQMDENIKTKLLEYLGRIFSRNYADITFNTSNTERKKSYLFSVKRNGVEYSGFNMGAGEASVMSMLYQLLIAGDGALMVIDEIELGLHQKAQVQFIEVLKEICSNKKTQIICSTHSEIVLSALPPQARFLVESNGNITEFANGISPEYAFGKLSDRNSAELNIYVEDNKAKKFLENILTMELRKRVLIYPVGSAECAMLQQPAACIREGNYKYISFFDGDKRESKGSKINETLKLSVTALNGNQVDINRRKEEIKQIIDARCWFLPGNHAPEKEVILKLLSCTDEELETLKEDFGCEDVRRLLESVVAEDPHDFTYKLGQSLARDSEAVWNDCCKCYKKNFVNEITYIFEKINELLNE